jgi:hypothetical protein
MTGEYSDLTGEFVTKNGVVISGAASMSTQVFKGGGIKKMCEGAHLRGYGEGFQEGFEAGYEAGLAEKVDRLVREALEKRMAKPVA